MCNERKCVNYYTMAVPGLYAEYRKRFPDVPSMLVQQIIKEACTNIRLWNSKHKKECWKYPGVRTANSYPLNKRTLSIRGELLTFSTTRKRVRTSLQMPKWFIDRYNLKPNDVQVGTIKLTPNGICINLQYRVPTKPSKTGAVIGIDRGL